MAVDAIVLLVASREDSVGFPLFTDTDDEEEEDDGVLVEVENHLRSILDVRDDAPSHYGVWQYVEFAFPNRRLNTTCTPLSLSNRCSRRVFQKVWKK